VPTSHSFSIKRLTDRDNQHAVNQIIKNPDLAPLLAVVKAARNGAVYGAKVRFPHALV
jgi:peroxisomal membrane protein 4